MGIRGDILGTAAAAPPMLTEDNIELPQYMYIGKDYWRLLEML
jgi:hypothetical protein